MIGSPAKPFIVAILAIFLLLLGGFPATLALLSNGDKKGLEWFSDCERGCSRKVIPGNKRILRINRDDGDGWEYWRGRYGGYLHRRPQAPTENMERGQSYKAPPPRQVP